MNLQHNRLYGEWNSFFGICYRKGSFLHIHVGGFPNWFQIRIGLGGQGKRFVVSTEDNR